MMAKIGLIVVSLFLLLNNVPLKDSVEQRQPVTYEAEETQEELCQEALIAFLYPYIYKAVVQYYGKNNYKQIALYDAEIISIERLPEDHFCFEITVQVTTFEGAHNPPYGIETITIRKKLAETRVINFKHENKPAGY